MLPLSKIMDARKRANKSKTAIAEACDCHVDSITRLEAGQSIALLQDYCNALELNIVVVDAGELRILQAFEAEKVKYRQFLAENRGKCGE